jgi:hypothetical protein
MKKHISIFILLVGVCGHTYGMLSDLDFYPYTEDWEKRDSKELNAELFNTKVIGNVTEIQKILTERYGFTKSSFTSADGLQLECLQRVVPDAQCTIICGAGFCPGNMGGCSSIIPMLPKKSNVIFYNNRGKGKSEKPWLYDMLKFWLYGINEYKDVIGALNHAKSISDKPIIMHSYCSSALHTTKAIEHLHKQDQLKKFAIAGLFLDSAVSYLPTAIENIPNYLCSPWSTVKGCLSRLFLWGLRYTIFARCFMPSGDSVRINTQVLAEAKIPTHHIYSKKGDLFTPCTMTENLYVDHLKQAQDNQLVTFTVFPESSHANHILKWKREYSQDLQMKIASFIRNYKAKQ